MESKKFTYETYYDQELKFEIGADRFTYRLDQNEPVIAEYKDIRAMKINRLANTLDIRIQGCDVLISVPFGMENFLSFTEELAARLAHANRDKIESACLSFSASRMFYTIMAVILSAPAILLAALLLNFQAIESLDTIPAVITFVIPVGLLGYGVILPTRAVPEKNRLILKGLLRKTVIDYSRIERAAFELLDMKKRGKLLVVALILKSGKTIRIKWLSDLIFFFMALRFHLDKYQKTGS